MGLTGTSYPQNGVLPDPYAHGYFSAPDGDVVDTSSWNPAVAAAAGQVSTFTDLKTWVPAVARARYWHRRPTPTVWSPSTSRPAPPMLSRSPISTGGSGTTERFPATSRSPHITAARRHLGGDRQLGCRCRRRSAGHRRDIGRVAGSRNHLCGVTSELGLRRSIIAGAMGIAPAVLPGRCQSRHLASHRAKTPTAMGPGRSRLVQPAVASSHVHKAFAGLKDLFGA